MWTLSSPSWEHHSQQPGGLTEEGTAQGLATPCWGPGQGEQEGKGDLWHIP